MRSRHVSGEPKANWRSHCAEEDGSKTEDSGADAKSGLAGTVSRETVDHLGGKAGGGRSFVWDSHRPAGWLAGGGERRAAEGERKRSTVGLRAWGG